MIRVGDYFDYHSSGTAGRILANSEELELTPVQQETIRNVPTPEQVGKLEEMAPERLIFEAYQRQRNR